MDIRYRRVCAADLTPPAERPEDRRLLERLKLPRGTKLTLGLSTSALVGKRRRLPDRHARTARHLLTRSGGSVGSAGSVESVVSVVHMTARELAGEDVVGRFVVR